MEWLSKYLKGKIMNDLRYFVWGNISPNTTKQRYNNHCLSLKQWPDFGMAEYQPAYIRLSALMIRTDISYRDMCRLAELNGDQINHFLYVCNLLDLLISREDEGQCALKVRTSQFLNKVKSIFFRAA